MKRTCALIAVVGVVTFLRPCGAGEITGTVTLKGKPPAEKQIDMASDAHCGPHSTAPTTHHYVVGEKGELANVVIFLQGMDGKSTGASVPPAVLDQKGCEYTPSILAVQTGQKIQVKNSDPTLHNVHADPAAGSGNKDFNQAQLAGSPDLNLSFSKPEMFLKFKCEVHPWMFAWVSVFDHPYFAVSAKDGTFKIANVPAGKYKIQAEHRKASKDAKEIEVKEGEPAKIDFTLEAK